MSVANHGHVVLFGLFFLMSWAQLSAGQGVARRLVLATLLTLGMGVLVELAQGITGHGNCRARDLIPDAIGAALAAALLLAWRAWRSRRTLGSSA